MKIVGIIVEFNPFHNGHKYLIQKAKQITNSDIAICIMSGNFTQLGNISIADKFKRAKIAIENGIDVVIELPTIYATASSQYFAFGAVNILNNLNCIDYLCFGSETANIEELKSIANKLISNDKKIWEIITQELKSGISFAHARQKAISNFLTEDEVYISSFPNNILAIEYIKSLIKLKSNILPIAIKRKEDKNILSATSIREMIYKRDTTVKEYFPDSDNIISNAMFNNYLFKFIKYNIVLNEKDYIRSINEVTEGLENKIYNEINNSSSYDEFIQNVKSKRYQLSKIKRIMIYIILNITKTDFLELNTYDNVYAHILAINQNKKDVILSLLSERSNSLIITSLNSNLIKKQNELIKKSLLLDIKSTNIYSVLSNDKINKDYTNKI